MVRGQEVTIILDPDRLELLADKFLDKELAAEARQMASDLRKYGRVLGMTIEEMPLADVETRRTH